MSDFESAQPQVVGGFAPPVPLPSPPSVAVADGAGGAVFGPYLPPLWAAVNVGRAGSTKTKKKVWTGVPGQYYWHAQHEFVVFGSKNGKSVTF